MSQFGRSGICFRFSISMEKLLIFSSPKIEGLVILVDLHLLVTSMLMKHKTLSIASMEEKWMVEKLPCSLRNMGPMQNGFTEDGSLRSLLGPEAGQGVEVLDEDTVMITGTGITRGEVAAGAGIDMTGIMAGKEVVTTEAGVVAIVQTMADPVTWVVMMLGVGPGAGLLKVKVLEGAYHLARPLLGVETPLVVALHHVALIRSDCALHTLLKFYIDLSPCHLG